MERRSLRYQRDGGRTALKETSEGFAAVHSGVVKTEVEPVAKYLGLGDDLALYS